jgi:hypothetical protein
VHHLAPSLTSATMAEGFILELPVEIAKLVLPLVVSESKEWL